MSVQYSLILNSLYKKYYDEPIFEIVNNLLLNKDFTDIIVDIGELLENLIDIENISSCQIINDIQIKLFEKINLNDAQKSKINEISEKNKKNILCATRPIIHLECFITHLYLFLMDEYFIL